MGPGPCSQCGRDADELHLSCALGGVCCERCHCAAAPRTRARTPRYRSPPPPKPSRYAQLVEDVYAALQDAGEEVTGSRWAIGGLGSADGRLTGWCPVCAAGLVQIQLLATDPPRARAHGCDNGCTPDLIRDAIWPPST